MFKTGNDLTGSRSPQCTNTLLDRTSKARKFICITPRNSIQRMRSIETLTTTR